MGNLVLDIYICPRLFPGLELLTIFKFVSGKMRNSGTVTSSISLKACKAKLSEGRRVQK